jgi:hypothetical protein
MVGTSQFTFTPTIENKTRKEINLKEGETN